MSALVAKAKAMRREGSKEGRCCPKLGRHLEVMPVVDTMGYYTDGMAGIRRCPAR